MPLTIYNKQINKISGPVSMRVLRPATDDFEYYKYVHGITLPIYILFGDLHKSTDNMCEICECKDGSSSCCYKVYDPNFMRLIDKVVSPGYSVDFFVEGWTVKTSEKNINTEILKRRMPGPLPMIRNGYGICYNRKLRGTSQYSEGCPTKGMRWQATDIRSTFDYEIIEGTGYTDVPDKSNKYTFELFCQFLIMDTPGISMILITLEKSEQLDQVKKVLSVIKEYYTEKQIFKYCDVIYDLLDGDTRALENLEPNESLIIKQISKFPKESLRLLWTSYVTKHMLKSFTSAKQMDNETPSNIDDFKSLIKYIKLYFQKIYGTIKGNPLSEIEIIESIIILIYYNMAPIFSFQSSVLDCYFICRSIKPTTGDPSVLTISYFGDYHNEKIYDFLKDNLNYKTVFIKELGEWDESNLDAVSRCIDIDKDINIDKMLKDYGYTIPKTGRPIRLSVDEPQMSYKGLDIKEPERGGSIRRWFKRLITKKSTEPKSYESYDSLYKNKNSNLSGGVYHTHSGPWNKWRRSIQPIYNIYTSPNYPIYYGGLYYPNEDSCWQLIRKDEIFGYNNPYISLEQWINWARNRGYRIIGVSHNALDDIIVYIGNDYNRCLSPGSEWELYSI